MKNWRVISSQSHRLAMWNQLPFDPNRAEKGPDTNENRSFKILNQFLFAWLEVYNGSLSSSRSGTLCVYGDSLGVRFSGSMNSRGPCKKLYTNCQNS